MFLGPFLEKTLLLTNVLEPISQQSQRKFSEGLCGVKHMTSAGFNNRSGLSAVYKNGD